MELCGIKPLALFLLFFMVIGLILFSGGTIFLALSPPKLEAEIVQYNENVDAWNEQYRDQFNAFHFNLTRFDDKSKVIATYPLDKDTTVIIKTFVTKIPRRINYTMMCSKNYTNLIR
jgi:hypothetical protein